MSKENLHQLQTTDPNYLEYETQEMSITVLGGIRTDQVDKLRVTLKVETKTQFIHHSLDLYNYHQYTKLIRLVSEQLILGSTSVEYALRNLIKQLEEYRKATQNKEQEQGIQAKNLSKEEKAEAEKFLKQKNLLEITNEQIGKSGVIGEEQNRILMYLIFTSRLMSNPLHIISFGSSGAGKTHLQNGVANLIPPEDKLEITVLSENAFYYFERTELKNKLLLIEDLDGAENALYPIRELQSKKRISKSVVLKDSKGRTKTHHLQVEGPVSIAGCTTREKIYEDNSNRSFLIYIDETTEQDDKIMHYQRQIASGHIAEEEQEEATRLLQNTQRILKPIKIINPYAEALEIPREVLKPRRTNMHYLQFIEAVTFYHQYQRTEKANTETGEIYIETTVEDIKIANKLIKESLLRKSDIISGVSRNHLEKVKEYLKENYKTAFRTKEIREHLRINHSTQKRYMLELQKAGYINKAEGNKQKGYHYEVVNAEEYNQLRERINNSLDDILKRIKTSSSDGSKEVQRAKRTTKVKENQTVKQEVQEVQENATEQKLRTPKL